MRSCVTRGLAAVLLSLTLVPVALAQEAPKFSRKNPVTEAVRKAKPSIVCIRVPRPGGGKDMIGSGVIVEERGIIVTNRHVVGPNKSVTVCLHDGTTLTGEVLAGETARDLAILRVQTNKGLAAIKFARLATDDLMEGETVIAIGHPYGYVNTVSTGIISALNREITMPTEDTIRGLIQITAAINPGNSGGALLNVNGELIGINVALREGAQNIAFAINAGDVKAFLVKHLSAGKVSGVTHNLQYQEKTLGDTDDCQRVLVAGMSADAALKNGDEIFAIGNLPVRNGFDIERALWGHKPGEQVALKVVRQGQELYFNLTLAAGQGAGQVANLAPLPAVPTTAIATTGGAESDQR
jgi:serine protease Do